MTSTLALSLRAKLAATVFGLALAASPVMAQSIFTPTSDGFVGSVNAGAAERGQALSAGGKAVVSGQKLVPGQEITLTTIESGQPDPILAEDITGIDADSSPLRFRACFTTPLSQGMLTETYRIYDHPEPNVGPRWFGCFDANAIGAALERGEALAFLAEADVAPGIDRVVAVFPDGRAYAWHQLNPQLAQGSASAVDQ